MWHVQKAGGGRWHLWTGREPGRPRPAARIDAPVLTICWVAALSAFWPIYNVTVSLRRENEMKRYATNKEFKVQPRGTWTEI